MQCMKNRRSIQVSGAELWTVCCILDQFTCRPLVGFGPDVSIMRLRCTATVVMMMMMMMMALLDFTDCVWMLSAPSGISMESVDMRHILKWRPLQAMCHTTLLYSVQFQGEFELVVQNNTWVDAPECQLTPHTHCDLTFDLGSDSNYNLQVRAHCGSQLSSWTELRPPFNRRDTVLTPPAMEVTAVGDALQVWFDKLPVTAVINVTVWKRGDELQAAVYTVPAEQMMLQVAALQEGTVYCVRARTVLNTQLYSGNTDSQCVSITGSDSAWKTPTAATVTVVTVAGFLSAVVWFICHCRPEACQTYFRKEPLPRSLSDWDIQISTRSEEAELYEQIHVLQSVDPSS
uniref:cytokine receptor family member B16 isoform X2 n=1 Tax=Scatophagus argus TaxID=75038 RepID=UPI001ED7F423|nr:cytokine receptor family member B16 isoform X2 [Scatophagus argus]